MEELITRLASQQGLLALLFVWQLVNNKKREDKLHETLDKFAEKYDVVIGELKDIKNKLEK